jgi:hypothetical protein
METPDQDAQLLTKTDEDGTEWIIVASGTEPRLGEPYLVGKNGDTWAVLLSDETSYEAMLARTYPTRAEAETDAPAAAYALIAGLRAEAGLWGYGSGMPGM